MKDRILPKNQLAEYLDRLMKTATVIAPVEQEGEGYSLYQTLSSGEQASLKYLKPLRSAKEVFFPQNEDLFYFVQRNQHSVEPLIPTGDTILFGVPPCDLRGIEIQDRLFETGSFQDSYYARRRHRTTILGLGCIEPEASCFCHDFDLDRFDSPLADLFFVPVQDVFYVKVNSERGEQLAEGLAEAHPEQTQAFEGLRREKVKFSTEKIPVEAIPQAVAERFDDPIWEAIAIKCIGCSACTFVCPTCHCFDITDEVKGGVGRRVRTWDSCAATKFTLHTSGHNPRNSKTERMRQRILHKFSYFKDNQGMISCTGCGRCIDVCPVNMDIREALAELLRVKA